MNISLRNALLCLFFVIITQSISYSQQVGIGTASPSNGSILDIFSNDKGILLPRIALTGTDDTTTITPAATAGLILYNTVTAGLPAVQVTPGFYYWDGLAWRRFFNQGYTVRYQQNNEVQAGSQSTDEVDLPGLDTGVTPIIVPYTGTYQIIVTSYYATGDIVGGNSDEDAASLASLLLQQSTNSGAFDTIQETSFSSTSRRIDDTDFNGLGKQVVIVINVELDAMATYRFRVRGREWTRLNAEIGYFGRNTNNYVGNNGQNDAQRGSMTITLIRQN